MFLDYSSRMIMKTNLEAIDGKIVYPPKEEFHIDGASLSLLNLKPNVAENGGFIFYDKEKPDNQICKIEYVKKRGKNELCYETQPSYRNKGYMSEAMEYTLRWFQKNSVKGSIWLLIHRGNVNSLRIAEKFHFVPSGYALDTQEWYYLDLEK